MLNVKVDNEIQYTQDMYKWRSDAIYFSADAVWQLLSQSRLLSHTTVQSDFERTYSVNVISCYDKTCLSQSISEREDRNWSVAIWFTKFRLFERLILYETSTLTGWYVNIC